MHCRLRLPSLKGSEVRLDLVVGIIFVFNLVIDAGDFLDTRLSASNRDPPFDRLLQSETLDIPSEVCL